LRRYVQAERLDTLEPNDPELAANLRDLERLGRLTGRDRFFRTRIREVQIERPNVVELGAAGGDLAASILGAPEIEIGRYHLIERLVPPRELPANGTAHCIDLLDTDAWPTGDVLLASLILHQFEAMDLAAIGTRARRFAHIICSEPLRCRRAGHFLRALHAVRLVGDLTLDDGLISIRAGFRPGELPALLGLDETDWEIAETTTATGLLRLVARRR
jgi:hypothetical protein